MKPIIVLTRCKVIIIFAILILGGCNRIDVRFEPTPGTSATQNEGIVEPTKIPSPTVVLSSTPEATPTPTPRPPVWESQESEFRANEVFTLLFDPQGGLWAGGVGGLTYWDLQTGRHTSYVYSAAQDGYQAWVKASVQIPDGSLRFGTFGKGILRRSSDGVWTNYTIEEGLPSDYISDLAVSTDGTLWIDTSQHRPDRDGKKMGHFGQLEGGKWVPAVGGGFNQIIAGTANDFWSLWIFQAGRLFDSFISYYDGEEWKSRDIPKKSNTVTAIGMAPDGTLWAGTKDEVFYYKDETWQKLIPPWSGQIQSDVSTIHVTPEGEVWFGFSTGMLLSVTCGGPDFGSQELGIYRYDGQTWEHFTTEDGLAQNKICTITSGPDGSIWAGTYDQGISRYDGSTWTTCQVEE